MKFPVIRAQLPQPVDVGVVIRRLIGRRPSNEVDQFSPFLVEELAAKALVCVFDDPPEPIVHSPPIVRPVVTEEAASQTLPKVLGDVVHTQVMARIGPPLGLHVLNRPLDLGVVVGEDDTRRRGEDAREALEGPLEV